jgi:hypothetical protein
MDMANATAAGPSYGLIDVLFGNTPKEEAKADGEGFGNLLKLIKTLGQQTDEDTTDKSRTDKETTSGRMGNEIPYSVMPGMMPIVTFTNQSVPAGVEQLSEASTNLLSVVPESKASAAKWLNAEHAALAQKSEAKPLPADFSALPTIDPETKALFSGMMIGHALAKAQRHPNTLATKPNGLIDAKEKNNGDVQWTSGEQQPIRSTQDFLNMRSVANVDAPDKAALINAGSQQNMEVAKDSIASLAAKQVAAKSGKIEAIKEYKGNSGE